MGLAGTLLLGLFAAAQDGELQKKIDQLIQTLSDDSKDARDKAVAELAKVGKPALESLHKAASSPDAEVKALAAQAIDRIEWGGGLDKLKTYVKERFDDGATVEPSKLKSVQRWFPDTKFFDVSAPAAAGGGAAMMMAGRGGGTSVFAVQKYEDGFTRVLVKGVFCTAAFSNLVKKQKIKIGEYDAALDFSLAFMELYWMTYGQVYMSGGNCRFEKIDDGWELQSQNYGMSFMFKTDKEGVLNEIVQPNTKYWQQQQGPSNSQKLGEEKNKLEIEKLKIELELLKRQLEESKKK